MTLNTFEKQVNVNLKGTYFLTKKFVEMKLKEKNTEANIVCISSETGSEACDIPYGLTKCAINSFVQSMAKRVYKNGIRINAISPAVTKTKMTEEFAAINEDDYSYNNTVGRVILPEEIAEIVCFFLSDKSKVISGEIIHCDAANHVKTSWEE